MFPSLHQVKMALLKSHPDQGQSLALVTKPAGKLLWSLLGSHLEWYADRFQLHTDQAQN